jgi:hypothetical protein
MRSGAGSSFSRYTPPWYIYGQKLSKPLVSEQAVVHLCLYESCRCVPVKLARVRVQLVRSCYFVRYLSNPATSIVIVVSKMHDRPACAGVPYWAAHSGGAC